ncbi:MAG: hypothetical protein ACT4NV_18310 [Rhodoferax sp.]
MLSSSLRLRWRFLLRAMPLSARGWLAGGIAAWLLRIPVNVTADSGIVTDIPVNVTAMNI